MTSVMNMMLNSPQGWPDSAIYDLEDIDGAIDDEVFVGVQENIADNFDQVADFLDEQIWTPMWEQRWWVQEIINESK